MMTYYIIKRETLQSMADAIRGKLDTSAPMLVADMASKITSIVGEGSSTMKLDLFPEQKVTGFVYDSEYNRYTPGGMSPAPFALRKDETYHVVWNGEEFTCTATLINYSGMNLIYIGDPSFIGLPPVDTPFTAVYMPGEEMSGMQVFTTDNKGEQLIRVYQLVNELPDDTYLKMTDGALETVNIDDLVGEATADLRYVTFKSRDGEQTYGVKPTAVGDDCANPIDRKLFDTPTRESTDADDFIFSGWSKSILGPKDDDALLAVTEDRTLYATFSSSVRSYTITYLDADGVTVLKTETLPYGAMPSYVPTKEGFSFSTWTPAVTAANKDASYIAVWTEKLKFSNATWADIARVCEAGQASEHFAVGDTRNIVVTWLNSSVITKLTVPIEIIGINHDDLADGTGKAGITIGTKYGLNVYNFANTGSVSLNEGWARSTIRTNMNSIGFDNLPVDMSEHIKTVIKLSRTGRSDSTVETTHDKLFIPSDTEFTNSRSFGTYGTQYEHYKTTANRIKTLTAASGVSSTTEKRHSTRTPLASNNWVSYINERGELVMNATYNSHCVVGFCI